MSPDEEMNYEGQPEAPREEYPQEYPATIAEALDGPDEARLIYPRERWTVAHGDQIDLGEAGSDESVNLQQRDRIRCEIRLFDGVRCYTADPYSEMSERYRRAIGSSAPDTTFQMIGWIEGEWRGRIRVDSGNVIFVAPYSESADQLS